MSKKSILAITLSIILGISYLQFYSNNSDRFEIVGPLAQGDENESFAELDGPLSNKISPGQVQEPIQVARGSKKLRDLPDQVDTKNRLMREMLSPKSGPDVSATGPIQTSGISANAVNVKQGFYGLSLGNGGNGWPPDTSGDVGINHYVQAVNTAVGVFNKSNGSLNNVQSFNSFMQMAGQSSTSACGSQNYGDPVVQFDSVAQKWIVLDFAFSSKMVPSYFCIAVSNSSDPTGAWYSYQILASSTQLADYPKMAVTPAGVVISANMFKSGRTYSGVNVWVLDRVTLFSGTSLNSIMFTLGNSYFSLMPVNLRFAIDSGKFTTAQTGFLLSDYGLSTSMRIFQFTTPNFTSSTSNKLNNYLVTVPASTKYSNRIPQLNGESVDALGDRLMYAAEADELTNSIYVSRTSVGSGTLAGISWYELPVTSINATAGTAIFGPAKGSTYSPADGTHRWMPSLAVNGKKELAIGFSSSNPSTSYPKISVVGRSTSNVGTSTLDIGEAVLKAGTGSQKGGYNRWGDYSRVSVDPVDRCTFWYTTEYYEMTGSNWRTWIAPFILSNCP